MHSIPGRLLVVIMAVAGAALTVFGVAVAREPVSLDSDRLLLATLLFTLVVGARLVPIHLGPKSKTVVDTAPLFAAALLLPVPLAMTVAALAAATADTVRRAPWFQALFNTAEVMLRVAAGATLCAHSDVAQHLANPEVGDWLVRLPLAALVMYLVNGAVVDIVVAVQVQRLPFAGFWRRRRLDLPPAQEGALFLLGLFAAAIGARFPWAMVLLAVPALVVQRSLRDGAALKVQTREALEELADVLDMRDHYTFEHSRRVAALARATAEQLGLPAEEAETIEMAGRVHDVGKIGIKSTVLLKPGRLTETEYREMRSHPEVGARLVAKFPQFARGRELVLSHHERYDGTGYPRGLAGDRIPLGGRVLAVTDAWDAMTSHRAYRPALDTAQVYAELRRGRGTQFDPVVLDAFLHVLATHPDLAVPHTGERQDVDLPGLQPAPA